MSTKRRRTGQSSSRSGAAREPPPQQLLPDDIEKENAAVLDKLPRDVWEKIVGSLGKDSPIGEDYAVYFPFAMTCRYFRDLRQDIAATDLSTLLESYSYMTSIDGDMVFSPTIHEAIYDGRFSVSADYLKWLFREARSTSCREAAQAAKTWDGRPKFVTAQGEQNITELAAAKGDLDLIKWLRNQDPPCEWSKRACAAAAWANRWDLLRNLVRMGCPIDREDMFGVVACDPNDWRGVISLPNSWDEKFEILKWLDREHGCVFDGYWMHSHVREVVTNAIYCNDLECLEWVLEQGVTWAKIVYREDYFQWLGLEEMDLTEAFVDVCLHAARLGRLEILQYAVEDGCPWDPAICLKVAEKKKHDHVVKWITNYAREASSSESYES